MKAVKLGRNQHGWLSAIGEWSGGRWFEGSGFLWKNYSGTVRLCESLTRHGLLRETKELIRGCFERERRAWEITEAGRAYLKANPVWKGKGK